ncbi:YbaB/EbfC family nucleoid-associated protein [uncultured Paracoccus sp.]|uniref:YbaB/EbfC family nucleoid-associated protein n=1 Tax=uncultured Paracoccus sp. TaxID=189685 RepID=UPI0025D22A3A|nr:YbaB/EbfC family nucleoid-associated protein [uncultured Paracoccus sp.]
MIKGLEGLGDLSGMMQAAQEMQTKMAEMQETLARTIVTGESGGGLVKARATAKGELTGLDIDPSIFRSEDKEIVEDLILAAIKDAQKRAADTSQQEMAKIASSMGLPPDVKFPF